MAPEQGPGWVGNGHRSLLSPQLYGAVPEHPGDRLCPVGVWGGCQDQPTLALLLGQQAARRPRARTDNKVEAQGSTTMKRPHRLRCEMKMRTISFHSSISRRARQHLLQKFCVTRGCERGQLGRPRNPVRRPEGRRGWGEAEAPRYYLLVLSSLHL